MITVTTQIAGTQISTEWTQTTTDPVGFEQKRKVGNMHTGTDPNKRTHKQMVEGAPIALIIIGAPHAMGIIRSP